jgi:hypothetical protein
VAIPKNITKEDIIKAINFIDNNGVPHGREQKKFNIKYNGHNYPPKYTISVANRYANGKELNPRLFSGGDETNPFLEARGFTIEKIPEEKEDDEHDYAPVLKRYLENKYSIKIDKIARARLRLPSGVVIHSKGSKKHGKQLRDESWFGLDKNIYEELVDIPRPYMAFSLASPEVTFVLPRHKMQEIFEGQPTKKRPGRSTDRWLFGISENNGRHILKLNNVTQTYDIEDYLNRWDEINDFKTKPNTLQDLIDKTAFTKESIEEIKILLDEKKQIIFYGPPGTSKTYFAREFASYFTGNINNVTIVQFHPSYSYEDFVEGIRPNLDTATGKSVGSFSIQPGVLKRLVQECRLHADQKFLLIIDEINRGNIPKIFGELLYLLEYRDQKISLTYSPREERFSLPDNLYFIGTMNSADRAIAYIDYALRRRFYFRNFYPDYVILKKLV